MSCDWCMERGLREAFCKSAALVCGFDMVNDGSLPVAQEQANELMG
jgi:hypothetical protein